MVMEGKGGKVYIGDKLVCDVKEWRLSPASFDKMKTVWRFEKGRLVKLLRPKGS